MNPVLLGAGVVSLALGVVFVVRPDRTAAYHDALSAGETEVTSEFGVAVYRINGVVFALVGVWLVWVGVTS